MRTNFTRNHHMVAEHVSRSTALLKADQAQDVQHTKAGGNTHVCGSRSVGLSHAGRARAHEVEPRADDRIAMDIALRDLETRRSLRDESSAVLPDAEKEAQSLLDPVEEALSTTKERCIAAWTTDAETSSKLYCVL